jgi:predicted RNA binding protein YcfA (HicA-like mRNA interferase family)
MTGKKILSLLIQDGWVLLRSKGSHFRLGKGELRVTVPVHGARDLAPGTLAAIEKLTGVKLL